MGSLARCISRLGDEDLGGLVGCRPEAAPLLRDGHATWAELARLLGLLPNVQRAVGDLNSFLGQALDLACLEGGRLTSATAAREGLDESGLAEAGAELARRGLAFSDPDGALWVPVEVMAAVSDPGRLGPPLSDLAQNLRVEQLLHIARSLGLPPATLPKRKAEVVAALRDALAQPGAAARALASAPESARQALAELRAAGGSTEGARACPSWYPRYSWHDWSSARSSTDDATRWLLAHGMVMTSDAWHSALRVPAEVERSLRGRLFAAWEAAPPPLTPVPLADERHPLELVTAMGSLLREWRHQPPVALQAGGVPKRELKRLARITGWGEAEAGSLAALAIDSGLVRERELVPEKLSRSRRSPRIVQSRQARIEVTPAAAEWEGLAEAGGWRTLVAAWQARRFGLASVLPITHPQGPGWRALLELLGSLPAGQGATPAELGRSLRWRSPSAFESSAAAEAFALVAGTALRFLGAGGAEPVVGLSAAGRHAFGAGGEAGSVEDLFPGLSETCTVTADHRVVVAGTPAPELGELLSSIAELVSVHPARVYRVTEGSLGRALDTGRTAAGILKTLAAHAPAGVPQNVAVLVEDIARRHGRLRVGPAGVCVVSDDPALIEELVRGRLTRTLRARRLAPTVAVVADPARPEEVMTALRRAGLMPVADGGPLSVPGSPSIGAAAGGGAARQRASPPPPWVTPLPSPPPPAEVRRLVAALRRTPVPAREDAAVSAAAELERTRALVAEAARGRRPLWALLAPPQGPVEELLVVPAWVDGEMVHAYDRGGPRTLRLGDLSGARLAEPAELGLDDEEADELDELLDELAALGPPDAGDEADGGLLGELPLLVLAPPRRRSRKRRRW